VKKALPVIVLLVGVMAALLLMEGGLHLLFPGFRLPYADARFSARYHHGPEEFFSLLKRIQAEPAAFKGDLTIAILGDSFVAGEEVSAPLRFTSVMQDSYDALKRPRVKIVNLGVASCSTMLYARLYRDVVLPLAPDVVIVCLDQTDVADDYLYEQELAAAPGVAGVAAVSEADFASTILKDYESCPVRFFLLRHSQVFLRLHLVKRRLTGTGFIPESTRIGAREARKMELYLETCKDPEPYKTLFENSAKYIEAIARMKPPGQKLYFVTYPRAENLAGQRKTTLLHGALPDSYSSTPFFEYWIKKENLAARHPDCGFVNTSEGFRAAIASTGLQYYFFNNDVHWNEPGHRLFAEILDQNIVPVAK
jgi:lysophospholipase L1-like esterase